MATNIESISTIDLAEHTTSAHKFVLVINTTDDTTAATIEHRIKKAIINLGDGPQVSYTKTLSKQSAFDHNDW